LGYELHHVLQCPCGTTLTADSEDEIVEAATTHLRAEHPDLAEHYGREHILLTAQRLVK